MGELGYRPNLLARSLVTQRSHTIGLAIPHLTNPFFAEVAQAVVLLLKSALPLFQGNKEFTAVIAYNDLMAIGTVRACKKAGRKVPDDCTVIGFDDNTFASLVSLSSTTIRVDKTKFGWKAVLRLLDMLDQPDEMYDPIAQDVEHIVRESA